MLIYAGEEAQFVLNQSEIKTNHWNNQKLSSDCYILNSLSHHTTHLSFLSGESHVSPKFGVVKKQEKQDYIWRDYILKYLIGFWIFLKLHGFHQTIKTHTVSFYTKQVGSSSSCRHRHGACKVKTQVVRNWTLTSFPDSGYTGIILWTWVKPWRTREQKPQASGSWRRGKEADWSGPAVADSLTGTTPAASSTDGQMDEMCRWMVMEIMEERQMLEAKWIAEDNAWQRNIRAGMFLTSFRRSMSLR